MLNQPFIVLHRPMMKRLLKKFDVESATAPFPVAAGQRSSSVPRKRGRADLPAYLAVTANRKVCPSRVDYRLLDYRPRRTVPRGCGREPGAREKSRILSGSG